MHAKYLHSGTVRRCVRRREDTDERAVGDGIRFRRRPVHGTTVEDRASQIFGRPVTHVRLASLPPGGRAPVARPCERHLPSASRAPEPIPRSCNPSPHERQSLPAPRVATAGARPRSVRASRGQSPRRKVMHRRSARGHQRLARFGRRPFRRSSSRTRFDDRQSQVRRQCPHAARVETVQVFKRPKEGVAGQRSSVSDTSRAQGRQPTAGPTLKRTEMTVKQLFQRVFVAIPRAIEQGEGRFRSARRCAARSFRRPGGAVIVGHT